MAWVRLDDRFPDHPKVDPLSDGAFRLHVSAICYAANHLTDGFIPTLRAARLVPRFKSSYPKELEKAGLWEPQGTEGWRIHHYLDFQPSADEVRAERERISATRAQAGRVGGLRSAAARRRPTGEANEAKREANHQANGEANTQASRASYGTKPHPIPSSNDLHPSSTNGCTDRHHEEEEPHYTQDQQAEARRRAERKLAERTNTIGPPTDPERWLQTVTLDELRNPTPHPAQAPYHQPFQPDYDGDGY